MIRNLIFDIGNVLLEYRWLDMMLDHGLSREESLLLADNMFGDPLWDELDLGNKSLDDIIAEYGRKYPGRAREIDWFLRHGEYMHVKCPDVWRRVHELRGKGYRIYLLSNYSEDLFRKHTSGASFMNDIDGMIISYQVHYVKPDIRIYRALLDRYNLKPEECIFYDDREANTKGARHAGIEAVTITSTDQLIHLLDARLAEPALL